MSVNRLQMRARKQTKKEEKEQNRFDDELENVIIF
jgi:hypothetical protein